ncbi:MAG: glutathione S-transferase family protein [Nannocystaceae bacterium]
MTLQLFGSLTSPFVRHCRIALLQLGHPWEFRETDYGTSAKLSPAQRVPFFQDGELTLTDSSVILQAIREKGGGRFLPGLAEAQRYHLANCVLDSAVNLFLLAKNGRTPDNTPYLARQQARVDTGLEALDTADLSFDSTPDDSLLRIGCLVAWAVYRKRFTVEHHGGLTALMQHLENVDRFRETAPPLA